jgi:histidinol-phosphate aminotransferase
LSIKIRKEIVSLSSYPAGKPISEVKREYGLNEVIKLASNENPLGCSKKATEAAQNVSKQLNLYPDPSMYTLKKDIAEKLSVNSDQIFCGTGTDLLIRIICTAIIDENDESIMGEVTFSRYKDATEMAGGKAVLIPMRDDYGLDLDAMAKAINTNTKIVWVCSPNNPTGKIVDEKELKSFIDKVPEDVLIVMDEAYYEYAGVNRSNYPDTLSELSNYPNMVILRTFSKAYGLAGLRVGYGICSSYLAGYFNRVLGPFDVNAVAQAAAIAALKDSEFAQKSIELNEKGKRYLYSEFDSMGLPYIETHANFIAVNVLSDDNTIFKELLKRGIIVKPGSALGMPGFIRVSIGTMEDNKKFIEALKAVK